MASIEICRLCTNIINSSIHPICSTDFQDIIERLIAAKISEDDGLPQNMCCNCSSQLLSIKCFQEKALDSIKKLTSLLKSDGNQESFRELQENNALSHCEVCVSSEIVKSENNASNSYVIQESSRKGTLENAASLDNELKQDLTTYCKLCNLSFKESKHLASHKRIKHKKLSDCSLKSGSSNLSNLPNSAKAEDIFFKKNSTRPSLYHCTICNIDVKGERELTRHKNKHCRAKCEICESYVRNDHLKKHMENIHSHDETLGKKQDENDKSLKVCVKKNLERNVRKRRIEKQSDINGKQKKSKVYNNSDGIILVLNDTIPYKYHCNICNIDFSGQKLVNYHKNKHFKKVCKFCGASVTYGNYSNHLRNHAAGKQVCDVCGAVLASFESLRSHIFMLHNDNKKMYECEKCNVTFRYKKYLTQHNMKIHTGFRPHVCDTCGKRFFALRLLKKHINTVHLKLRNNICEYCKKGFSSRYALKVHIRQHTNETPYVCVICSDGFRQPVSLRTHMKSKHDADLAKSYDTNDTSPPDPCIIK